MSLAVPTYFNFERLKTGYIQTKMQSKTPLDLISKVRIDRYLDCFYVFGSWSCCPRMILRFTWGPVFISVQWFPEQVSTILGYHKSFIMRIPGSQNKQTKPLKEEEIWEMEEKGQRMRHMWSSLTVVWFRPFLASVVVPWSVSVTQLSVIVSSLLLLFLVITQWRLS